MKNSIREKLQAKLPLQPSLVILKRSGETPMMGMCNRCELKFFTPPAFLSRSELAYEYLHKRFREHSC